MINEPLSAGLEGEDEKREREVLDAWNDWSGTELTLAEWMLALGDMSGEGCCKRGVRIGFFKARGWDKGGV